jgi:hypothetical protein
VVSAYRITRFEGSNDVYGLDVAVDTFVKLAHELPDLKLAIFLAHAPGRLWSKRYGRRILAAIGPELHERFGLWVDQPLHPAFGYQSIYLRPTRTDGDAVSIREALDAQVPVIASDAIGRPPGVHVLSIGSSLLWSQAVRREVATIESSGRPLPATPSSQPDHRPLDRLLELYSVQLHLAASSARP